MSYRVRVSHEAEKRLDRLDGPTEQRIRSRFQQLAEDPFNPLLSSPLTARPGVRKSRVGDWRILFTVEREDKVVYIATIETRGQVYRR